jgi:mono/diheme cytochrome c family protein
MIRLRAGNPLSMLLAGAVFVSAATLSAQNSPPQNSSPQNSPSAAATHRATVDRFCIACHRGNTPAAGLHLDTFDFANFETNGATWEKLARKLRNREMPPADMRRPDESTYKALVEYVESGRDRLAEMKPNPGRPTLHRLNRTEYGNAVRDLLALEMDVTDLLPADDIGYGFDNIGDVLQVSPVLLERYLSTARKISRAAVGDTTIPVSYQTYDVPHRLIQEDRLDDAAPVGSRGGTIVRHLFPVDAEYEISVTLARNRDDEYLGLTRERKLDLRLDDRRIQLFTIAANPKKVVLGAGTAPDAHLKIRLPVKAGTRELAATFLKDTLVKEGIIDRVRGDDVLTYFEGVGSITVAGPFNVQGSGNTVTRERIFICHPSAAAEQPGCAKKIVSNLAHRAYRRPVSDGETAQLLTLYNEGARTGGFEGGVRLALQKILVSPEFLFRAEVDPPGAAPGTVYKISDIELASRLSFFLWSSIPDDQLLAVAESGRLSDPLVLQTQVKRMLADPRSQALVKNFAGQWLYLRNIARISPDQTTFPNFDDNLRAALAKETELLIESQMREDHPVTDLLTTDYTFLNQRLAEHYGIKGIYGNEFRRVKLEDPNRYGLLGQASILAVTSYPNRTAPTIRGKWVLEQLLGSPPPPPPPNVPSLKDDATAQKMTMRQRMEQHRANPTCAACHKVTDPLGFALENFDGLGIWRVSAGPGSGPIDASGTLPDGTAFIGPAGLRDVLMKKQDMFVENFTERLMTYALGRGVEEYDYAALRKIAREAAPDNQKWSSIIYGIVKSTPFRMRRASDGSF